MNKLSAVFVICLAIMANAFGMSIAVVAQTCTGSDHLLTIDVNGDGNLISGAVVKFYFDPEHARLADNLRTPGVQDATVTTDAGGRTTLALAAGTYYATVSAGGYKAHEASVIMPADGSCGAVAFSLTPSASTAFDPSRTVISLSKARILADDADSAVVTVRSFNKYGSIAPFIPVDLTTTHEGMKIIHHATTTDANGLALFTLTGIVPGSAFLTPILDSQVHTPILLTLDPVTGPATTSGVAISVARSEIAVHGSPALPDNVSAIEVVVTVRDALGKPIPGVSVTLRATGDEVQISQKTMITDAAGVARFALRSSVSSSAIITATAGNVALNERPIVHFQNRGIASAVGPSALAPGARIKLPDDGNPKTQEDTTVYYVGADGRRHPFLNERVYQSWYASFAGVSVVSATALSSLALGAPVTYRPGTRLVKVANSPKVYALAAPRTLRWIANEDVAGALHGPSWRQVVDDMPESFMFLYETGADIVAANDYFLSIEQQKIPRLESACSSADGNRCP